MQLWGLSLANPYKAFLPNQNQELSTVIKKNVGILSFGAFRTSGNTRLEKIRVFESDVTSFLGHMY